MNKIFNTKTIRWFLIACAGVICVYQLVYTGIMFGNNGEAITLVPSLIWILVTMALIIVGSILKKDKLTNCGLLVASPFIINSFTSGFSKFASMNAQVSNKYYNSLSYSEYLKTIKLTHLQQAFKFSPVYGIVMIASALALLCVAAAFIVWILKTFFNIKISDNVIFYLAIAAVALYLVTFVLTIVVGATKDIEFLFFDYIVMFSQIAYVIMFVAAYNRKTQTIQE